MAKEITVSTLDCKYTSNHLKYCSNYFKMRCISLEKKNDFEEAIKKLRNGQLEQIHVEKEEFPLFREVLMSQKDKERIRGEAKKGGEIIYTYAKQ